LLQIRRTRPYHCGCETSCSIHTLTALILIMRMLYALNLREHRNVTMVFNPKFSGHYC
jgi:ABC-type uncharacterized transport system permease subunit